MRETQVEFMTGPATLGAWLFAPGDMLVVKINGGGATLIMTSMRGLSGDVLAIKVERLEARAEALAGEGAAVAAIASTQVAPPELSKSVEVASGDAVPIKIAAHIRTRGDMSFADAPWAGRVGPGLWIESFSVLPLTRFKPQDIEYKGLTGSGFETPWISEEKMCGTKGMAVPLVGFAARLKGTAAGGYDCEYSGYFQSGVTVGPLRNGAPSRSTTANDPLEGIALRLVKRSVRRQSANRS